MADPVTPEWLDDLGGRIFDLATEAERRFGDPGPCQYPSEVEMLLHMAHNAARRKGQDMKDARAFTAALSSPRTGAQDPTEETS